MIFQVSVIKNAAEVKTAIDSVSGHVEAGSQAEAEREVVDIEAALGSLRDSLSDNEKKEINSKLDDLAAKTAAKQLNQLKARVEALRLAVASAPSAPAPAPASSRAPAPRQGPVPRPAPTLVQEGDLSVMGRGLKMAETLSDKVLLTKWTDKMTPKQKQIAGVALTVGGVMVIGWLVNSLMKGKETAQEKGGGVLKKVFWGLLGGGIALAGGTMLYDKFFKGKIKDEAAELLDKGRDALGRGTQTARDAGERVGEVVSNNRETIEEEAIEQKYKLSTPILVRIFGDEADKIGMEIYNERQRQFITEAMLRMSDHPSYNKGNSVKIGELDSFDTGKLVHRIFGGDHMEGDVGKYRRKACEFILNVFNEHKADLKKNHELISKSADSGLPANFNDLTFEQAFNMMALGPMRSAGTMAEHSYDVAKSALSGNPTEAFEKMLKAVGDKAVEIGMNEFAYFLKFAPEQDRTKIRMKSIAAFAAGAQGDGISKDVIPKLNTNGAFGLNDEERRLMLSVLNEVEGYMPIQNGSLIDEACRGQENVKNCLREQWDSMKVKEKLEIFYLVQKKEKSVLSVKIARLIKGNAAVYTEYVTNVATEWSGYIVRGVGGWILNINAMPPELQKYCRMVRRECAYRAGQALGAVGGALSSNAGMTGTAIGAYGLAEGAKILSDWSEITDISNAYNYIDDITKMSAEQIKQLAAIQKKYKLGSIDEALNLARKMKIIDTKNVNAAKGWGKLPGVRQWKRWGLRREAMNLLGKSTTLIERPLATARVAERFAPRAVSGARGVLGRGAGIAGRSAPLLGKAAGPVLAVGLTACEIQDYRKNVRPVLMRRLCAEKDDAKRRMISNELIAQEQKLGFNAVGSALTLSPAMPVGLAIIAAAEAGDAMRKSVNKATEYMQQNAEDIVQNSSGSILGEVGKTSGGKMVSWGQELAARPSMFLDETKTFDKANINARREAYTAYSMQLAMLNCEEMNEAYVERKTLDTGDANQIQNRVNVLNKDQLATFAGAMDKYIANKTNGQFNLVDEEILRRAESYARFSVAHWKAQLLGSEAKKPGLPGDRALEKAIDEEMSVNKDTTNRQMESLKEEDDDSFKMQAAFHILHSVFNEMAFCEKRVLETDFSNWFSTTAWSNLAGEEDFKFAARGSFAEKVANVVRKHSDKTKWNSSTLESARKEIAEVLKVPPDKEAKTALSSSEQEKFINIGKEPDALTMAGMMRVLGLSA